MTRATPFAHPLLLGFDGLEQLLDRAGHLSNEGYPPFNIERFDTDDGTEGSSGNNNYLRITLAVAGFAREDLSVTVDRNELTVRGQQGDDADRAYLHRGIAARRFTRVFVLADGMEVSGAELANGLLTIDLVRPEPKRVVQTIDIAVPAGQPEVRRRSAV